jgi:hypothetical protein
MSYVIYWDKFGEEDFENMTMQCISDEYILASSEFENWAEAHLGSDIDSYTDEEKIDGFRDSDDYFWYQDSMHPMMNYVHILEYNASCEAVQFLLDVNPTVVIGTIESLDVDVICLSGGGMDLSDCIELAYYVCDGKSPVKSSQPMVIPKDIIMFCRDKVEESGFVHMDDIKKYVEERKDDA